MIKLIAGMKFLLPGETQTFLMTEMRWYEKELPYGLKSITGYALFISCGEE